MWLNKLLPEFTISFLTVLKLALIQMSVSGNKADNVKRACSMVKKAASKGARLVALPVSVCERFMIL